MGKYLEMSAKVVVDLETIFGKKIKLQEQMIQESKDEKEKDKNDKTELKNKQE